MDQITALQEQRSSPIHSGDSTIQPDTLAGSATVRAPGVCGELVQGMLGDTHFLVTCPVDFFARIRVDIGEQFSGVVGPADCPKAAEAVTHTLAYLGKPHLGAEINVSNPIPRGKGFGSSSADVAAAIAATALALGVELTPAQIGKLAVETEPTDGIMFPGIALFDHREGLIAEELGPPLPMEILALDFGGQIDTLAFNRQDRRREWQAISGETSRALDMVREGIRLRDTGLVGKGATHSALAAQEVLFKPRLAEVMKFAESVGAVGVNVAHSGTAIGVLLDATQRRGKSTYRMAQREFPDAEAVYHLRLLGGGVHRV